MLERLLTTGLGAAGVFALAALPLVWVDAVARERRAEPAAAVAVAEQPDACVRSELAVTVIDVAPGVSAASVTALVRLSPGERIAAINDREIEGDAGPEDANFAAGAAIAQLGTSSGSFVDLTVSGGRGERRVLVLRH